MTNFKSKPLNLSCGIMEYPWGKKGSESIIYQYALNNNYNLYNPNYNNADDKPLAEFWMGTHHKLPSKILESNNILSKELYLHPEYLSTIFDNSPCIYRKKFEQGKNINNEIFLPFLFKVLSVGNPLSIQVHPDKKTAQILHEKYPNIYQDDNHKPEICIALSEFEALCKFRSIVEIVNDLQNDNKELCMVIGEKVLNDLIICCKKYPNEAISFLDPTTTTNIKLSTDYYSSSKYNKLLEMKDNLKKVFTTMMKNNDKSLITSLIKSLKLRINTGKKNQITETDRLFLRLADIYPDDIGCFVAYFLNYVKLKPGEAMFLEANELHAYLLGDCIECMACSDNVIRAGLTTKFIDIDTLCDLLTYFYCPKQSVIMIPLNFSIPLLNSENSIIGELITIGSKTKKLDDNSYQVSKNNPINSNIQPRLDFSKFDIPIKDFQIESFLIHGETRLTMSFTLPSIFIHAKCNAKNVTINNSKSLPGNPFFLPVNTEITIYCSEGSTTFYRAFSDQIV